MQRFAGVGAAKLLQGTLISQRFASTLLTGEQVKELLDALLLKVKQGDVSTATTTGLVQIQDYLDDEKVVFRSIGGRSGADQCKLLRIAITRTLNQIARGEVEAKPVRKAVSMPIERAMRQLQAVKLRADRGTLLSSTEKTLRRIESALEADKVRFEEISGGPSIATQKKEFKALVSKTSATVNRVLRKVNSVGTSKSLDNRQRASTGFSLFVQKRQKRGGSASIKALTDEWRELSEEARNKFIKKVTMASSSKVSQKSRDQNMKDLRPKQKLDPFRKFVARQLPLHYTRLKDSGAPDPLAAAQKVVLRLWNNEPPEKTS
eukprot:TRINITY_DN2528_c4_g1_i1.p1 TRINITY_DN2528_c4_g1~~TRINITY_DN2528_c4_g1_i1.p1  ORF type:complete len:320 (+),score=46.69 TRINITY_DN2528_c4_g1_i1:226-1185(+)